VGRIGEPAGGLFRVVIPVLSGGFFLFLLVYSVLDSAGLPVAVAAASMFLGVVVLAVQRPHVELSRDDV